MINDSHNKSENEKHKKYDIKRLTSRHRHKYAKYKMCLSIMMVICIKQNLSSIISSIHDKVKQD